VQKPQTTLGQWLRSSTEAVPVQSLHLLMDRFKKHERKQHTATAILLGSGMMPDLLYSASSRNINPAMLCLMHACGMARTSNQALLPALPEPVASTPPPTLCTHSGDTSTHELGEMWWLFDADPYLAEVFKNGIVPGSRLPHMDRTAVNGDHVARILGCDRPRTKLVQKKAAMCLYTRRYDRACIHALTLLSCIWHSNPVMLSFLFLSLIIMWYLYPGPLSTMDSL
jgi:hypothetical protein